MMLSTSTGSCTADLKGSFISASVRQSSSQGPPPISTAAAL